MTTPKSALTIETQLLEIPLVRPHRFSVLTIRTQGILLVRVRTADGTEGIGEGVVPGGPWWGGESIEGISVMVERYLAPLLVGDAARVDYLAQRMNKLVAGAPFAKAALEMALWDARGKSLGVPLYQLLGGAHRTRLPVTWALGADSVEVVTREAFEKLDRGQHFAFKLKMGALDPSEDVARVRSIAKALVAKATLSVDLNGSWDELTAMRWLPALEDAGISLIEQPVAAWNLPAMTKLAEQLHVPIMADESLRTPQDAVALASRRAAGVFAQKLAKSGGVGAVGRIGVIAEAHGIPCYGGTTIESSIGTAAAVHTFCASASLTAGTELFGPLLLADDLTETPVHYDAGHVHLPDGPGLGIVLDEAKVARYTRERARPGSVSPLNGPLNGPRARCTAVLRSGRRDSNPRHQAWEACTLPTELLPLTERGTP